MLDYLRDLRWITELEIAIYAVDDLRTDCAGMTMIISALLQRDRIPHRCMQGGVLHLPSQAHVVPHHWIEIDQDIVIDLRLRMWLGDTEAIPHGIIDKGLELDLRYSGQEAPKQALSARELDAITEGRSKRLRLPLHWRMTPRRKGAGRAP